MDNLFFNPYTTINQISAQLKVTYPTAKKIVDQFIKLGILKETKQKEREKLFVGHEILNIITV